MLIGVSLLGVAFVAVSLWLWQRGVLRAKTWAGAFVLVAWVVGVGVKVHFDQVGESRLAAIPSIAWPSVGTAEKEIARAPFANQGVGAAEAGRDGEAATQVAPVSSLVGGLEKRLAAQPGDVEGWALLAQSYAFMGDAAAADGALKKAVALGMDERALRARVDTAMRSPHPK
jgi:hypothetical protein